MLDLNHQATRGLPQIDYCFQSGFGSQQNREGGTKISPRSPAPTRAELPPPPPTPQQTDCTFAIIYAPAMTHRYCPGLMGFTPGVIQSMVWTNVQRSSIHHYSITQNNVEKAPVLHLFIHTSPPPNPWQPQILLLSPQLRLFQSVRWLELHQIQPFQIGFLLPVKCT